MIDRKMLEDVCRKLVQQKHTISIAESVTSGLLQNIFANAENASSFFEGGITAYNLHQKCTHLFIDPVHAVTCNCVSETVAAEMALGISNSFKTDWGIAVTGYASAIPEAGMEELYACYAISFHKAVICKGTITAGTDTPENVQRSYATAVIRELYNAQLSDSNL